MKDDQRKAMFANIFKGSDKRKTQVAEFGKVKNLESGLEKIKKERFSFKSFQDSLPRVKPIHMSENFKREDESFLKANKEEMLKWEKKIKEAKSQTEIEKVFKEFKKSQGFTSLTVGEEKKIKNKIFAKARTFPDEDEDLDPVQKVMLKKQKSSKLIKSINEQFVAPKKVDMKIAPQVPGIVGRAGKGSLLKNFGTTTQFHKDFEKTIMELSSEIRMPPWDADKDTFAQLDNHFKNRFSVEDKKKLITLWKTYEKEGFTERRIANMLNLALTGKGKDLWQGKIKKFYDEERVEGGFDLDQMPVTKWADNYFDIDEGELH